MTTINVKPPLQPLQYARNGKYPDAYYQAEMAELANHLALYRQKEIARFGMTVGVIASPSSTTDRPRWRTRYRSSPNVGAVACQGSLALSVQTLGEFETEAAPYAKIEFDTGGAAVATGLLYYGQASTASSIPDDLGVIFTLVRDADDEIWTPTADTLYNVTVTDARSRIAALTLNEVSLTLESPWSEGYADGTPILDLHRQELIAGARLMWKRQAAPLCTWTVDDQAAPRTRTSATACNLIDNSSTAVATSTPGYTIDCRNRSTVGRTTVPCVFEAYAKMGSFATEGAIQLRASDDSVLATLTINSTTAAWYTTTVSLPATLAKYDLYFVSNGAATLSAYAACLRQYASGS